MIDRKKKLFGILACVLLLAAIATPAYAHETVDVERSDCSLTVVMKYDGEPVAGGNLILYKVGNIVEDDGDFGFELRPDLNCNIDMAKLQSEETSNDVCNCVMQQGVSGTSVDIDANGLAVFSNLNTGLYLVRQQTAATGFNPIKPFLISAPQWDGEHYTYHITAAAKTELEKLPTESDKPQYAGDSKLPQTGQLNWPVPVLFVIGGICLIAGLSIRKKHDA